MTADSGIATVERADRARGVADVCAPHWCHWIAVTFQGPSSGPELKHRGILEAKSDEVKKTKKKNNACVRIRPRTCVGEWHEIRIIPHSVPVAKQTGCNVCEMTFALPEEFRRFTELGLRIQSGGEEGSRARAERERASHEVGKQKERSGQVDGGNKKKTWHQMEGHEAQTPPGNWTNQLSSTLKKVRKSTERACTLFHHGMREFQANRLKKKKKKRSVSLFTPER